MSTTDTTCGNCEGIDPASCLVCGPRSDTERDERLREARTAAVVYREAARRGEPALTADQQRIVHLYDAVARLDAVVTAVRNQHRPGAIHAYADECSHPNDEDHDVIEGNDGGLLCADETVGRACTGCYDDDGSLVDYPCPTVRALDGGAA